MQKLLLITESLWDVSIGAHYVIEPSAPWLVVSFAKKVTLLLIEDIYSLVFAFSLWNHNKYMIKTVIVMMMISNRIFFYILTQNEVCMDLCSYLPSQKNYVMGIPILQKEELRT